MRADGGVAPVAGPVSVTNLRYRNSGVLIAGNKVGVTIIELGIARPKSGNALSPAEKQRRYRARLAAKAAAKATKDAEVRAAENLDPDGMAPKRLAQLIWERRGRKAALAVRTTINKLAEAEDRAKAAAQAKLREAAREAEFRASGGSMVD